MDTWRERIVSDPNVHHGEPCVRGTPVSVSVLVGSVADLSVDELLRAYPQVTLADVQAALAFAAESARNSMVA